MIVQIILLQNKKNTEKMNQERDLERRMEVRGSVEDKDSEWESDVNEESKSAIKNEQSDSENERLIRLFVIEYEMEYCWKQ